MHVDTYIKRSNDEQENQEKPDLENQENSDLQTKLDGGGFMAAKALEIGEKALEKQFEIMEEQQKKGGEFADKKV